MVLEPTHRPYGEYVETWGEQDGKYERQSISGVTQHQGQDGENYA